MKIPSLYHGTDLRFVEMPKEERTIYLSNCNKIIDYLWERYLPLLKKETVKKISDSGEVMFCFEDKIQQMKQFFYDNKKQVLFSKLRDILCKIELNKNNLSLYQYDCLCFTENDYLAEIFAHNAFSGGEKGYIAYYLICGAEFLNLFDSTISDDLQSIIKDIKQKAESETPLPVVFTADDLDILYLYHEDDRPIKNDDVMIGNFKYKKEYTFDFNKMRRL